MISTLVALALAALPLSAAEDQKEADRLDNCGTVLKEILDIPDNIPTDLLDKAECVIVIPSVLKAAFVIGGSYGKGAMTCRSGGQRRNHARRDAHVLPLSRFVCGNLSGGLDAPPGQRCKRETLQG